MPSSVMALKAWSQQASIHEIPESTAITSQKSSIYHAQGGQRNVSVISVTALTSKMYFKTIWIWWNFSSQALPDGLIVTTTTKTTITRNQAVCAKFYRSIKSSEGGKCRLTVSKMYKAIVLHLLHFFHHPMDFERWAKHCLSHILFHVADIQHFHL